MADVLHVANPGRRLGRDDPALAPYGSAAARREVAAVRAHPDYRATPLHPRPAAARRLGLASLDIKDEGARLAEAGLASFKAVGVLAALASSKVRAAAGVHTLTCASDGNYGRAVAWAAAQRRLAARIFVPEAVSQVRVAAIAGFGAEVVRVPGGYDDAVAAAAEAARQPGVLELSDTGPAGIESTALSVSRGYTVIAEECLAERPRAPTHLFVPVGVGGLAAGLIAGFRRRCHGPMPVVVAVEPIGARSLMTSLQAGRVTSLPGVARTLVMGLACETPSPVAWPVLRLGVDHALAIADSWAVEAMRELADGAGDPPLVAGETGAASYGALLAAASEPRLRAALGLDADSRVLVPVTEGATDPDIYRRLVSRDAAEILARPVG